MAQVPRTQKLWRVPYFQLLILFFGMLDFCNKNQMKENQGDKRREREKKREKESLT